MANYYACPAIFVQCIGLTVCRIRVHLQSVGCVRKSPWASSQRKTAIRPIVAIP